MLREREFAEIRGGGFGFGALTPRFCEVPLPGQPSDDLQREGDGVEGGPSVGPVDDDQGKPLIDRVVEKARAVARSVLELIQVIHEASGAKSSTQTDSLIQVLSASHLMLGRGLQTSGQGGDSQGSTQSLFTPSQDAFWANPENVRALGEIERAIQERNAMLDIPSFSLGLTQDWPSQRWDEVVDVGRQYDDVVGVVDVARVDPPNIRVSDVDPPVVRERDVSIVYMRKKIRKSVI
ncbi:PREDICTED: uncharacterized protein LOC109178682 isoform X2 [Ipomoea nil]|nr:PREDICTED: uncharacterized protein LOC109178682 isoform X2 [Ipomoea nil]